MKNKFKIGDRVIFRNMYGYPTISGSKGVIRSTPSDDRDYNYYGMEFDQWEEGNRMAVLESELMMDKQY